MEKRIWSDSTLDHGVDALDEGQHNAARGLLVGLAISQVFWLTLALFLFWKH